MAYDAKILLDSVAPHGVRLTTMEVTYPRFVHSELMTHRVFSRNAASSRAIPIERMIQQVMDDPAMPVWWGKAQPGMQAAEELAEMGRFLALQHWLFARDAAVRWARDLKNNQVHKQIVNRLLEPFAWITVIITATDWENFFSLRCHPDAQPELKAIADRMQALYREAAPQEVPCGTWHLPLVNDEDRAQFAIPDLKKLSTARSARVSYLTHAGKRDPQADFDLHDRLLVSGHMSPFEHCAAAVPTAVSHGNLRGWRSYRKEIPGESGAVPQGTGP